jgi:putative inorganic carbon (HCO3(-)) transporter
LDNFSHNPNLNFMARTEKRLNRTGISRTLQTVLIGLIYGFTAFSLVSIAGTGITFGMAVLVWLVKSAIDRKLEIHKTGLEWPFALFILACVVSSIFSVRPAASFHNLKNLLAIGVVYLVATHVTSRPVLRRMVHVFVAASALVALVGVLGTDIMGGRRVMALQSTTMTWGAMSAIFTVVTVSMLLFGGLGKWKLWYGLAFAAQFLGMLFSYVRGAWIGFAAGVFVLGWIKNKKLILALVAFLALVFLVSPAAVQKRVLRIADLEAGSTQVRLTQWRNAVPIFLDHPITGVGWIDLGDIHRAYAPPGADLNFQAYRIGHFHNNFVMFAVCLGAIGFVAAMFLIVRIAWVEYRHFRSSEDEKVLSALALGSLAAFVGFWFNGLFDWTFGDAEPVTLLWLTVGWAVAVGRLKATEKAGA